MRKLNRNIVWAILFLCLIIIISPAASEEYNQVNWEDLRVKIEFEDPFDDLSTQQLSDLSHVARLRETEQRPDSTLSPEDRARKDDLEQQLSAQGVDIDALLARRWEIAELRRQQFESVNRELNNTRVDIGGYLLPLNLVGEKVTEFLLVPWVGACIHTPPPPQNQLIYVESKEGIGLPSRFQPVRVGGIITTDSTTSTLFLVDGSNEIVSGYRILNATIKML